MNVENLKNYGKSHANMTLDPEKLKQMRKIIFSDMRKELGLIGMMKLMWKLRKANSHAENLDWLRLRENGLTDRKFLRRVVQRIVLMKTLSEMVGNEKAERIFRNVMDKVAYDLMTSMTPTVEELKACGDVLECFKKYFGGFYEANERCGASKHELVEDTNDVFAFNITYCAWHEVAKELGNPYLCYPSVCYGDEVFFPKACAEAGFRFERNGTLATGARVCDFRFERITSERK